MLLTKPLPHRLAWCDGDRAQLPGSAASIVASAVCPDRPQLAWLTDVGLLNVFAIAKDTIVARLYFEATP